MQFKSVGFLQDNSFSPAPRPQPQQIVKYQHCDKVGHVKDHCFYFHPCKHCGQHTHHSNKFFRNKPPARTKIHLGWIAFWQWALTTKKIFRSYHKIWSRVLKSLAVKFSSSSHLVSDKGGIDDHLQASKIHQVNLSHSLNLLPKPTSRDIHT